MSMPSSPSAKSKPQVGRPPLPDSERADAQIQLRVTSKRKASYVRAANRKKQTLAACGRQQPARHRPHFPHAVFKDAKVY